MEFKTRKQVRDVSGNSEISMFKIFVNRSVFEKIKIISQNENTFASEIIRCKIFDFISNYKNENTVLFRTKKELSQGTPNLKEIKINLNKEDFISLRQIAEENNTYASEIIRELMADFVEKYEAENADTEGNGGDK